MLEGNRIEKMQENNKEGNVISPDYQKERNEKEINAKIYTRSGTNNTPFFITKS